MAEEGSSSAANAVEAFDMDFYPVEWEDLSPGEFLGRLPHIRENIAAVKPVPAILGQPGFGSIRVIYRRPIYRYPFGSLREGNTAHD